MVEEIKLRHRQFLPLSLSGYNLLTWGLGSQILFVGAKGAYREVCQGMSELCTKCQRYVGCFLGMGLDL
jgi:hypothetical protein